MTRNQHVTLVKVLLLTLVVLGAFTMSSFGWRHLETTKTTRILIGSIIMLILYLLMIFELVNRTLAALIGAAVAIAAHDCLVDFVNMEQILRWEDLETLALLFGMMVIVSVLGRSGLFDFLAIWSYRRAAGRFWALISLMAIITAILSAFIDNVSTMLLMSPTLIKLSELEHVDPRYVLMIMVIFCNIGGCATPVGDPPNLIIIGDSIVARAGITFGSFVATCGPCVLITIGVILVCLRLFYKSKESFRLERASNGAQQSGRIEKLKSDLASFKVHLEAQLSDCKRIVGQNQLVNVDRSKRAGGSSLVTLEADLVTQLGQLELKLTELETIEKSVRKFEASSEEAQRRSSRLSEGQIQMLMRSHNIKSRPLLILALAALLVAVLFFFLQSLPGTRLTLGWVSLFAALTLLVMSSSVRVPKGGDEQGEELKETEEEEEDNFELAIADIEWSTLIFFFSLFIVMEVMSKLGLIEFLGHQISHLIGLLPAGNWRSMGSITIILWSSALASALIDNVPFTSMMVKVLGSLMLSTAGRNGEIDFNSKEAAILKPMVFALAFGCCYGGNGTLIGASANLVTAGVANKCGYPISFMGFVKFAWPLTVISLLIANFYLVLVFVAFDL